tara:strand:+ start:882 stop:1700 length:819 start_codon:yes stop_codon:yes gene_type:complete
MKLQNIIKRIKFNILFNGKINIKKYIFTIGAPRSGTTLLCQMLNNHPNVLLSNEDRTIEKVLYKKIKFDEAIKQSNISAYEQFIGGYRSIQKIQSKWIELKKKKLLDKKNILISGDKKSGQNAEIFNESKNDFVSLFKKPNIFFIHIVRNPIAAAKSYEKSHFHEISNFDDALEKILMKNSYGFNLGKIIQNNYIKIYYEDLVNNPEKIMKGVIDTFEKDLDNNNNKIWLKLLRENFNQIELSKTNYKKNDLFNILKDKYSNEIYHYKKYLY